MSSNYERLIPARIAFNERGIPVSPLYGDAYHPGWGAREQALKVFLHGNGLPQRWRGRRVFTVCETGFGLGNNFLALWQSWRDDAQRPQRLHVVSFEAHPLERRDLRRLLASSDASMAALAQQLIQAWPPLLPGLHRLEFEGGRVTLTLAFGAAGRLSKQLDAQVDAYFLDGFAPRVNPEMWTPSLFGQLVRMANRDATAATWCCAGAMRRALQDAGFLVSKRPGHGGKREMTVAVLRPGLGRAAAARPAGASVLVVGGGLAGAGAAQALSLRGHEVTVVDPVFEQGLGASHRGHIAAALSPVISSDDDIRARLSRAGVARALHRWQGLPEAGRPWRCGTLEVARGAEALSRRKALDALGFPAEWVRWLDASEVRERTGLCIAAGGLWFADGQRAQPQALLESLLSLPGISCRTGAVARLAGGDGGVWRALDAAGRELARAEHVVLANAHGAAPLLNTVARAPRLPKLAGLYRMAGEVGYFQGGEGRHARAVLAGDGYWLPPVEGICVAGSTYDMDADRSEVSPAGREAVARKAGALLGLRPDELGDRPHALAGWAGWRAAVADRLPVIGPLDGVPGLWLACAYGSRGLSWSALAGDIIAARINGEPVPLERELLRKIAPR